MLITISLLAVAGLVGGAGTGQAATGFTVDLTPLIGTTDVNVISQVTYGGNIGYHLVVDNTGTSSAQHATVVVTSGSDATFVDSDNPACVGASNKMTCSFPGDTLLPDDPPLDVRFRFKAPTSGTSVTTTAALTISAQTVGSKKNQGTTLEDDDVVTNLALDGAQTDTFLRVPDELTGTGPLTAGHRQNFGVDLVLGLFGNPFGIPVSIHDVPDLLGPFCTTCLPYHTDLSIPAASDVSKPGNPFFDGTVGRPYEWTMNARYDSNRQVNRVVHIDEMGLEETVPACSTIGGAPTASNPLCWETFQPRLQAPGNQKLAKAVGKGLENGKIGFG